MKTFVATVRHGFKKTERKITVQAVNAGHAHEKVIFKISTKEFIVGVIEVRK